MMRKQIVKFCLLGAPIGLAISTVITIIISLGAADGAYYPVPPALAETCGSELSAVVVQTACSLVYGAAWGGVTAVWSVERWSLLRQTLTHLAICVSATFPIAYFMYWMPHTAMGVLTYFGIFFLIYLLVWLGKYLGMKRRVEQFNRRLSGGAAEAERVER